MWRASALRRGIRRASAMVCAAELAHQHRGDSRRSRAGRRARRVRRRTPRSASSLASSKSRTTGRSATPPTASRTLFSVATAAQATMAKSPWRRANSRNAKPSPGASAGKRHGLDQLVIVARGRHQAGEELFRRHAAAPALRRQNDVAAERDQHQRQFRARIGQRDRAANRAARARLRSARPTAAPARATAGASPARATPAIRPAAPTRRRGSHCLRPRCRQAPRHA